MLPVSMQRLQLQAQAAQRLRPQQGRQQVEARRRREPAQVRRPELS